MTRWWPKRSAAEKVPGWQALDLPWREAELWVVDLETTGLDLRRDEVVAWGAVPIRHGRVQVADGGYGLVRPTTGTATAATAVHGLLPDRLATAAPPEEAAAELAARLRGGVLVAHAAWVETAFLDRMLAGLGARFDGPVIDTAALARAGGLVRGGADAAEPSLEQLSGRLGLPVHTPHHALGDALTTAVLALALIGRWETREQHPPTVRELALRSSRSSARTRGGPLG